jgi:hypothetical protein
LRCWRQGLSTRGLRRNRGYFNFLEAIQDPEHEEHEMLLEWIGGGFDPETFDLDHINSALRRIR